MAHYGYSVRKVNLDTGEESLSDFTEGNEVAGGGVIPEDYASSNPEFDTTGVKEGQTVEVDGRTFVFDGENWRWLPAGSVTSDGSGGGDVEAGGYGPSSLRYKVGVTAL